MSTGLFSGLAKYLVSSFCKTKKSIPLCSGVQNPMETIIVGSSAQLSGYGKRMFDVLACREHEMARLGLTRASVLLEPAHGNSVPTAVRFLYSSPSGIEVQFLVGDDRGWLHVEVSNPTLPQTGFEVVPGRFSLASYLIAKGRHADNAHLFTLSGERLEEGVDFSLALLRNDLAEVIAGRDWPAVPDEILQAHR